MTAQHYPKLITRILEKCLQLQLDEGPNNTFFDYYEQEDAYPVLSDEETEAFSIPITFSEPPATEELNDTFFGHDEQEDVYPILSDEEIEALPMPITFSESPATEEQICETETQLGFALPVLLREIYMYIANGGFGPGEGLMGAIDGFGWMVNGYLYMKRRARIVDIADFEHRINSQHSIVLPDYLWPTQFVELCHWGCAVFSYLDVKHDRVFRGEYMSAIDHTYGFKLEAPSLEAWWELWINGALS